MRVRLAMVVLVVLKTMSLAIASEIIRDYDDPLYSGHVRQLYDASFRHHNIYYWRDPWNADRTRMVSIREDQQATSGKFTLTLANGDGCYIRDLWAVTGGYDWRIVWDAVDPDILYTLKNQTLYAYNVATNIFTTKKQFVGIYLQPNGPSLNQSGDRIMLAFCASSTDCTNGTLRSYRLSDMGDERIIDASSYFPAGCISSWRDQRYIGYQDFQSVNCKSNDGSVIRLLIFDGASLTLYHTFEGISSGHADFSPTGQFAYFRQTGSLLEIRMVNLDGNGDVQVFAWPNASYVDGLHLTWPNGVNDWFIVSFFPWMNNLPASYSPPLDEIVKVNINGTIEYLARSYTSNGTSAQVGDFWVEPMGAVSKDGSRIAFNSACSIGTNPPCFFTSSATPNLFLLRAPGRGGFAACSPGR